MEESLSNSSACQQDFSKEIIGLDALHIQSFQQNKYPCLFVDHVSCVVPGVKANGFKNFSYTEFFLGGTKSVFIPSVFIGEALEQVFLMTFLSFPEHQNKKTATLSCDFIFVEEVVAGSELAIESHLRSFRRGLAIGGAEGKVNGRIVAQASFVVCIPDVMDKYKPKSI